MKNSILIFTLLFVFLNPFLCEAQTLSNRLNFGAGLSSGQFHGDKNTIIGNTTVGFPMYFPNFEKLMGYYIQGEFAATTNIHFGINLNSFSASNWIPPNQATFSSVEAELSSVSPFIKIATTQKELGFWNRFRTYLSVSPTLGVTKIRSPYVLADLEFEGFRFFETKTTESNRFYGYSVGIGVDYFLWNEIGLKAEYTYSGLRTGSTIIPDRDISLSAISIGLFKRFLKEKRIYR